MEMEKDREGIRGRWYGGVGQRRSNDRTKRILTVHAPLPPAAVPTHPPLSPSPPRFTWDIAGRKKTAGIGSVSVDPAGGGAGPSSSLVETPTSLRLRSTPARRGWGVLMVDLG